MKRLIIVLLVTVLACSTSGDFLKVADAAYRLSAAGYSDDAVLTTFQGRTCRALVVVDEASKGPFGLAPWAHFRTDDSIYISGDPGVLSGAAFIAFCMKYEGEKILIKGRLYGYSSLSLMPGGRPWFQMYVDAASLPDGSEYVGQRMRR